MHGDLWVVIYTVIKCFSNLTLCFVRLLSLAFTTAAPFLDLCASLHRFMNQFKLHNRTLIIYYSVTAVIKLLWTATDNPMQGKYNKRNTKLTIIFSKRSMISFSERFMERSSKRGWGIGSSAWVDRGSVGCCIRGFSFFPPVFLKLVIRSRWKKTECLRY